MRIIAICTAALLLFLLSCAGTPPPEEPVAVAETPSDEPESVPEETPVVEEDDPEPTPETDEFQVTEEVYEQTFDEIEALIKELNEIISRKQFDRWLNYLSSAYKREYNSKQKLNEISEYPQLKDNGIVLKDIRDYFNWVVVPSRSQATLGEIVFENEIHVAAYSTFEGKRALLYQLEKIDDEWTISVW